MATHWFQSTPQVVPFDVIQAGSGLTLFTVPAGKFWLVRSVYTDCWLPEINSAASARARALKAGGVSNYCFSQVDMFLGVAVKPTSSSSVAVSPNDILLPGEQLELSASSGSGYGEAGASLAQFDLDALTSEFATTSTPLTVDDELKKCILTVMFSGALDKPTARRMLETLGISPARALILIP